MRIVSILAAALLGSAAAGAGEIVSGQPVPRYVSLKSDRVNVRKGPGTDYPIDWVFNRAGLPVEVIDEVETWRQVRDSEGAKGWVLQSLLSGRRTALVLPWETGTTTEGASMTVPVHATASASSTVVALVEAGTLASLLACDRSWCHVSIEGERGYVEQVKLWGVYKDETIE